MTVSRARILFPVLCASFLVAALAGYGCGSSSSSNAALCQQGCDKVASLCFAEAGAEGATIKMECLASCNSQPKNCTNQAAIDSAAQACLAKTTCTDLQNCSIPACVGGTGAGGTTGGAGTSGGGGTTGSAGTSGGGGTTGSAGTSGTAATCADLLACCNAASTANKANCMTAYTAAMGNGGDATCASVLAAIKSTYCP